MNVRNLFAGLAEGRCLALLGLILLLVLAMRANAQTAVPQAQFKDVVPDRIVSAELKKARLPDVIEWLSH